MRLAMGSASRAQLGSEPLVSGEDDSEQGARVEVHGAEQAQLGEGGAPSRYEWSQRSRVGTE